MDRSVPGRAVPNFDFGFDFGDDEFNDIEERTKNFVDSMKSAETKRKTSMWINKLCDHKEQLGIKSPLLALSKQVMNNIICSFFIDARKEDGGHFETSSMNNFFSVVKAYLKENRGWDLESEAEFQGSRDVKKAKLKLLKTEGKGNRPNRAEALTFEEEEALFESGEFGFSNPTSLQRTVWYLTTLYFGHRGRDESRQLKWRDIELKKDDKDEEYLEYHERTTKTRTGEEAGGSRAFAPKAFKNHSDDKRCPVRAYKEFSARRPDDMKNPDSPFYLAVNNKRKNDDGKWYMSAPLGKNTIGQFIKKSCGAAGITGRKTNHSVRKTCVKRALDSGCPREYVAQLTGHKSVNSLENYADADVHIQKAMAMSVSTGASYAKTMESTKHTSATSATTGSTIIFNISGCQNVNITNQH